MKMICIVDSNGYTEGQTNETCRGKRLKSSCDQVNRNIYEVIFEPYAKNFFASPEQQEKLRAASLIFLHVSNRENEQEDLSCYVKIGKLSKELSIPLIRFSGAYGGEILDPYKLCAKMREILPRLKELDFRKNKQRIEETISEIVNERTVPERLRQLKNELLDPFILLRILCQFFMVSQSIEDYSGYKGLKQGGYLDEITIDVPKDTSEWNGFSRYLIATESTESSNNIISMNHKTGNLELQVFCTAYDAKLTEFYCYVANQLWTDSSGEADLQASFEDAFPGDVTRQLKVARALVGENQYTHDIESFFERYANISQLLQKAMSACRETYNLATFVNPSQLPNADLKNYLENISIDNYKEHLNQAFYNLYANRLPVEGISKEYRTFGYLRKLVKNEILPYCQKITDGGKIQFSGAFKELVLQAYREFDEICFEFQEIVVEQLCIKQKHFEHSG